MQSRFKSILYPERGGEGSRSIFPLKDGLYISEVFENPVNGEKKIKKKKI